VSNGHGSQERLEVVEAGFDQHGAMGPDRERSASIKLLPFLTISTSFKQREFPTNRPEQLNDAVLETNKKITG
jgi:hypothetical protein